MRKNDLHNVIFRRFSLRLTGLQLLTRLLSLSLCLLDSLPVNAVGLESVRADQRVTTQEIPIIPTGIGAGDSVGESISVGRNQLMIGAPGDDELGADSGAVYAFDYVGGNWIQTAKLIAPGGQGGDRFGVAVSLNGTRAIIGASRGDGLVADTGVAYVYEYNGVSWQFTQKLMADDGAFGDLFGIALAIEDDRVLIGASADDDLGGQSGSAYLFERQNGVWTQLSKLTASDGGSIAEFGTSVSLSGDRALISAPGDDEIAIVAGAAYLFEPVAGIWTEQDKLLASDGALGDGLGVSASLEGDRVLLGAPGSGGTGAVYAYEYDGMDWQQVQRIVAADVPGSGLFGDSLDLAGDEFITGAPGAVGQVALSGAAYRYQFNGTDWALVEKLAASNGVQQDQFGTAVGLFVGRFAVGADFADRVGNNSGSGYLFQEGVDLDLSLMAGSQGIAGTDYNYNLLITNNGPETAINLRLDHSLNPAMPIIVSNPCSGGFPCLLGDLDSGQSISVHLTTMIPIDASGFLDIQSSISSDSAELVTGNELANRNIAITQQADIEVSQTGPLVASAGDMVSFDVTVRNLGPSQATNVVLTDSVSAGLVFVSASAPCAAGFPCSLGTLAPGAEVSLTVNYQAMVGFSGTATHTNTATSDATDIQPDNNSSAANVAIDVVVDLALDLQAPISVIAGNTFMLQYDVTNSSVNDAPNVVIHQMQPMGVSFISSMGPCAGGFPCDLGTIAAGASTQVQAVFQLDAGLSGMLDISAAVSSLVDDSNPANDSDAVSIPIEILADLMLTMNPLTPATAGTIFSIELVVANLGPSDAVSVQLNETSLSGASFVSASAPCGGGLPCMLGTLLSGESETIALDLTIDAGYVGQVIADYDVTSSTTDPDLNNNQTSFNQAAAIVHDLVLEKRSFVAHIDMQGLQHFYEIVLRNDGPSRAVGARITDAIPALLINPSWTCAGTSADCPQPASGVGDIDLLVNLDVGGEIVLNIMTGLENLIEGDEVLNEAFVQAAAGSTDPVNQNNRDDDLDVVALFADGLEDGI